MAQDQDPNVNRNVVVKVLNPALRDPHGNDKNKLKEEFNLVRSMPDDPYILKYLKFFDQT